MTSAETDALRPLTLDDYAGQADLIDEIRTSVRAARRGRWQLDHALIVGPKGLGKTSLALVVAGELGVRARVTSAPAITHRGELASLLAGLGEGDVLFIDEIHRLAVPLQEVLYTAMEDRVLDMAAGTRVIRVPLPRFTLIGATTHVGLLAGPLRDRFGFCWQLRFYTVAELTTIVLRSATKLCLPVDEAGAAEIARRSRGTPRLANRLLRRVRDFVAGSDAPAIVPIRLVVGSALAAAALDRIGVDALGLGALDLAYLRAASTGPVGVETIASALSEQRRTIEDAIEPFLVQVGLVTRTRRGRVITDAGRRLLDARPA